MSFHPHMTAPGSGFGHMKFMKDMKGMMNMMEQLKKHNKDGEVWITPRSTPASKVITRSVSRGIVSSGSMAAK